MASRFFLSPEEAALPTSAFPQLLKTASDRYALAFDAASKETCYWTRVLPQGWTGTPHAYIFCAMLSAVAGDVDVNVAVEAVTPADALNVITTKSFDTANAVDNTSVPANAGYLFVIDVTLTNFDSGAAGDVVRFSLDRDAADDTATGDMYVLGVEIRDGA